MDAIKDQKMLEYYINSCCLKEVDGKKYVAHKWNINENLKGYSSVPSKEHDEALLALLSINITDDNAILNFCRNYGRLGLMNIEKLNFRNTWNERRIKFGLSFDNYDDWMVADKKDDGLPHCYQGYESLDLYRAVISSFQCCAKLRDALNEKNLKKSVELTCYLLDFLYIPNDVDVSDFGENLLAHLGLAPKYYIKNWKFAAPWSDNYFDGTISFNFDLDSIFQKLSADKIEKMLNYCQYILSFWVSEEIGNIRLNMSSDFINGKFTASMSTSNMHEFLWYIMFLKFTNSQIIRTCASSTCNNYFIIQGNDKRKIYCDTGCANIEAKRAERKRNREKKEGEPHGTDN